jgi:hypothetical protein
LRYLVCIGLRADEAQDVVQDAFVSLQKHLAAGGGGSGFFCRGRSRRRRKIKAKRDPSSRRTPLRSLGMTAQKQRTRGGATGARDAPARRAGGGSGFFCRG